MQRIPPDVLTEIFCLSLPDLDVARYITVSDDELSEPDVRRQFENVTPRNVSFVCRDWRNIALSTGRLWAHWCIDVHYMAYTYTATKLALHMALHFVRQCLTLSRDASIDCFVRLSLQVIEGAALDLITMIVGVQNRWRRVQLKMGYPGFSGYTIHSDLTNLAASPLTELRLWNSVLALGPNEMTLEALRVLYLKHMHPTFTCLKLVLLAPNLEELCLVQDRNYIHSGGSDDSMKNFLQPRPLRFDRLRLLLLSSEDFDGVDVHMTSAVLNSMTCPTLKELEFDLPREDTILSFASFILRSDFHLTSLNVALNPVGESSFMTCLLLLPSLQSLEVHGPISKEFLDALTEQSPSQEFTLCPLLEHVRLDRNHNRIPRNAELIRLVESRWRAPRRCLESICLLRCSDLDADGEVRSFPAQWVAVERCVEEGLILLSSDRDRLCHRLGMCGFFYQSRDVREVPRIL